MAAVAALPTSAKPPFLNQSATAVMAPSQSVISVALRGGEMTVLIGPNGAGKSTLLRLLTGYLTPDSGTRHLAGKPLEAWSPEALSRRRAVMLQRTALQADWTVETVSAMGRSPWGATADPAVLAAVNLADELLKNQAAAENLRRQVKNYLDEATQAKNEASELKRQLFKAQQGRGQ